MCILKAPNCVRFLIRSFLPLHYLAEKEKQMSNDNGSKLISLRCLCSSNQLANQMWIVDFATGFSSQQSFAVQCDRTFPMQRKRKKKYKENSIAKSRLFDSVVFLAFRVQIKTNCSLQKRCRHTHTRARDR